jgi:C4-dicarboxylate transporter, DctQ subunit
MRSILGWLDRNLEKTLIIAAYSTCASIIAVEVFRRYAMSAQAPWSTTVPAYMFLWLTWIGAAHGVKIRAHLNFSEVRIRLSRKLQFVLMQIDNVLYLILASVVIYYGFGLLQLQIDNQSVVPGTDTIPQWWFYSATPVGWLLLVFRVVQNVIKDCIAMRTGAHLDLGGGLAAAN